MREALERKPLRLVAFLGLLTAGALTTCYALVVGADELRVHINAVVPVEDVPYR